MNPQIDDSCYISDKAVIIGQVVIEGGCSIWPFAVIRGDKNSIEIKEGTNIQDHCMIHTTDKHTTTIGRNTSVGHGAIIHGANVGDNCIIGINAVLLDGAEIQNNSIVGAGSVVTSNTKSKPNSLLLGVPAKTVKISNEFYDMAMINAKSYHKLREEYKANVYGIFKKHSW